MKRFNIFAKVNANLAELHLYGTIGGGGFFSDGISANDVVEVLSGLDSSDLNIYINSPGGDVFQGMTIYNTLNRFQGKKTVYVDGVCASIASIIAMVGDKIITAPNATWMIHEPWAGIVGNAAYMRAMADRIDKHATQMRDTYAARTNQSLDKITEIMAGSGSPTGETWLSAQEALDYKFTDEIGEFAGSGAKAEFPLLDRYQGTPEPMRVAARSPKAVLASMTRQLYLDSIRGPVR